MSRTAKTMGLMGAIVTPLVGAYLDHKIGPGLATPWYVYGMGVVAGYLLWGFVGSMCNAIEGGANLKNYRKA